MKYQVEMIKNVPYVEGGRAGGPASQTLDLYIPKGRESFPAFVFFHGGGFMHYNWTKDTYSSYCTSLAESGIAVAAPNYRLYPEFPGTPKVIDKNYCDDPEGVFDGFMDDAAAAVYWTREHIGEYGPASGDLFIGGHSAGAWQTMMLLFNEKYMARYGMGPDDLRGCVFASGQPTSHYAVIYARGMDPKLPLVDDAAPIYYMKPLDVPQLVTMAEHDIPGRDIQTQMYLFTLKAFDYRGEIDYVFYEGRTHNNCVIPDEGAPAVPCALHADTVRFIEKHSRHAG